MQAAALHQALVECAGDEAHLRQLGFQHGALGRCLARVGHDDVGAAAHAPARHGQARGTQAQDQHAAALQAGQMLAGAAFGHGGRGRGGFADSVGLRIASVNRRTGFGSTHVSEDAGDELGRSLCGGAGLIGLVGRDGCESSCSCSCRRRLRLRHGCGSAGTAAGVFARQVLVVGAGLRIVRVHRSFSVDRLSRHSSRVMIQKRTTTCVSVQPLFSKWWCSGAILSRRRPVP